MTLLDRDPDLALDRLSAMLAAPAESFRPGREPSAFERALAMFEEAAIRFDTGHDLISAGLAEMRRARIDMALAVEAIRQLRPGGER